MLILIHLLPSPSRSAIQHMQLLLCAASLQHPELKHMEFILEATLDLLELVTELVVEKLHMLLLVYKQWGYGTAGFPLTPKNYLVCWETAGQQAYAIVRLNEKPPFYAKTGWFAFCW